MIRVLVADDHPIVRHGIRQFVADISDIVVADDVTAAARCSTKRDR
jgi:DNA-binding NarL/FixJ family response regulator